MGPSGLEGPGTTLWPVHAAGEKGNSSRGAWPPALEPQGFAGEGSTRGVRGLALRSQLRGVIWGRLSQGLGWSVGRASLAC